MVARVTALDCAKLFNAFKVPYVRHQRGGGSPQASDLYIQGEKMFTEEGHSFTIVMIKNDMVRYPPPSNYLSTCV